MVAEMVRRWGAFAGDDDQIRKGEEHHAHGYMEYDPLWDFLFKLGDFAQGGVSWWDASFKERVESKLRIREYRDDALELISGIERDDKPWVWKDPALCHFLPFWKEIWGEAAYIITVRNPYDTALSWQEFVISPKLSGSLSLIEGNLLRWQHMILRILQHTDDEESKIDSLVKTRFEEVPAI